MSGISPLSGAQLSAAQMDDVLQTAFAARLDPEYGSVNLGAGSPMAALMYAVRQLNIIIQAELVTVANFSRLNSSNGPDVTSYVLPFGFGPLPGSQSIGTMLFGTNSPVTSPVIAYPGLVVQRQKDGVQYVLLSGSAQNQPNWSDAIGGYTIPTGSSLIPGTFQAVVDGAIGNIAVNEPMQVYSGVGNPGQTSISQIVVTNAFSNGFDGETDIELRKRFQTQGGFPRYATRSAILAAVASVQTGLVFSYGDNRTVSGAYRPAWFSIIVNAGNSATGPSPGLIALVKAAVDLKRAGGIEFDVYPPTLIPVTVTGQFAADPGYNVTDVAIAITTTVQNYINSTGLNVDGSPTTLSYVRIAALMLGVLGVANVSNVLINGAAVDLTATFGQQFVASAASNFTS